MKAGDYHAHADREQVLQETGSNIYKGVQRARLNPLGLFLEPPWASWGIAPWFSQGFSQLSGP